MARKGREWEVEGGETVHAVHTRGGGAVKLETQPPLHPLPPASLPSTPFGGVYPPVGQGTARLTGCHLTEAAARQRGGKLRPSGARTRKGRRG